MLPAVHPRPARHHRQRARRQGGAARGDRAPRPGRSVPRRGSGQGHRDILRYGECAGGRVRLLAGGCLRFRRFEWLRS